MYKKLAAECIGTYFLVFAGTGAVIVNALAESLTLIGISLTFGLVVTVLIYTFGHISGAHINPAVTIGLVVHGDMHIREALYYIISQVIGALLASATLLFLFGNIAHLGSTLPSSTWNQSFVLEFILTFLLMLVILGSAVHKHANKTFAGIAIGATVALAVLIGGPISGASMNPARSLGPALISGTIEHLWIYIVATISGAIAAVFTYKSIYR